MFPITAGLLILAALAFLLLPLLTSGSAGPGEKRLRRALRVLADAEDAGAIPPEVAEERRVELNAELAAQGETNTQAKPRPWVWIAAITLMLPLATVALYREIGAPYALDVVGPGPADLASEDAAPDLQAAIAGLEAKLEGSPDDTEGWVLLGRSYMAMRNHEQALIAFRRARELAPTEPVILVDYAEALAFASESGALPAESRALLEQAVAVQPMNQKALWLLGMGAFQAEEYGAATEYWGRLAPMLEPGSTVAGQVQSLLDEARRQTGATAAVPDEGSASAIALVVDISPELAAANPSDGTLFVFARLPQGPRMPLAVKRFEGAKFPMEVTLSDADAMTPAMTLSSAEQVVISARISASGNASPQAGDLQAVSAPIATSSEDVVTLIIDSVVDG